MKLTLSEFKEAYPEMHDSIYREGFDMGSTDGYGRGKADGVKEGAESERSRIQSIDEQATGFPRHDALVSSLKYDGVTTGPEAAVKILAAEKELRGKKLADFQEDNAKLIAAPVVVDEPKIEEQKKPAAEQFAGLVQEKMSANPNMSYAQALALVSQENKDLSQELLAATRPVNE